VAVNVGEAAFETVVVVAEFFVLETEEVQDGGVEIIDAGDIDGGFPAKLIGLAMMFGSGLHTGPSENAGEAARVVIAT
jgi:hypothetical protein